MSNDREPQKGLVEIAKDIASVIGIVATFFLGFQTFVKAIFETTESRTAHLIAFGIVLLFFICLYLSRFWKPSITEFESNVPPGFLSSEEQLKYHQDFTRRKKEKLNQENHFKSVRRVARAISVIIPLFILSDLLFWVFIHQSFLWRSLYLAELSSQAIPELVSLCSSSNYKIQINHPESWDCQKVDNPITQAVLVLTPDMSNSSKAKPAKLIVQVYSLPELQSLKQFTLNHIELLKEERFDNFKLLQNNESTVMKQKGRYLVYETKEEDSTVKYMEFITLKNEVAYLCVYFSDEVQFLRHQRAVIEMVKTIKLLE
jgi:hypothetical protein